MAKARGRNSTGCPLPIRDGRWTRCARHAESRGASYTAGEELSIGSPLQSRRVGLTLAALALRLVL